MENDRKRLVDACAPVFLFLTTFRRNSSTSTLSIEALHGSLQREIENARHDCERDRQLGPLFERVFYSLVAAADQVVLSSDWQQRAGWSMKLLEMHYFSTAEGGKRFFHLVDEVLQDPTDEAAEIADFLFTCMALGFQGELFGEHRELERRRRALYEKARLPGRLGDTLTPDAYGRNAARQTAALPTVGTLRLLLIAVSAVVFALVVGNIATGLNVSDAADRIADVIAKLRVSGG